MKKIKHLLSLLSLCGFSLLFYASGPGTTKHITKQQRVGAEFISACKNGQTDVVKHLLDKGVNPDLQDNNGVNALIYASENGHAEIVKLLLEKGAKVDLQYKGTNFGFGTTFEWTHLLTITNEGATALMIASQYGYTEVVKLLLEKGARIDLQAVDGSTALMGACAKGRTEIVKLLLGKGAKIDLQANNGTTALMWASLKGPTEIVKLLLDKGANLDLKSGRLSEVGWPNKSEGAGGVTALILASGGSGHADAVKLLLDKGAKVDSREINGKTPLMVSSEEQGNTEIVKLLLYKGANPDLKDNEGKTAIDYAKNDEIKKLLTKTDNFKDNGTITASVPGDDQQKEKQDDTITSKQGHTEKGIKEINENERYDLLDLCKYGFVRAKGTGQSITNINAEIQNLTHKKIRVVIKPGTYFVAGDGYQNMVSRKEYAFTLNPLSKKHIDVEASCINAALDIPEENENFSGVSKVPDDLARFLDACAKCNSMVVQAGVWAITDDYTGAEVQEHLEKSMNGVPVGSAVSDNDIAEARKILKRLGIKTNL